MNSDDINALPSGQRKVFEILARGGKYSVADIARETNLCDPRCHIANMRKKGFTIADNWVISPINGTRFKLYFLENGNKKIVKERQSNIVGSGRKGKY